MNHRPDLYPSEPEGESLGTAIPRQQARVREVLGKWREMKATMEAHGIQANGMIFQIALMEDTLRRADIAVISGDIVAMLRSHADLLSIE